MKILIALATAGLLSLGSAAFAQDAGTPGATGTGGGLTGANTGTGGATQMSGHSKHATGMGMGMGMHHRHHHAMRHMMHSRHMAMHGPAGDKADNTPNTVQGDQAGQMK